MKTMETFTGRTVDPLDMDADQIDIRDIAHALALQCRYNGHCKQFYSVAQHSLLAAKACPDSLDLYRFALLHDAAEAYMGDMISPMKVHFPEYKWFEDRLSNQIYTRFCGRLATPEERREIKEIDTDLLVIEARSLMHSESIHGLEHYIPRRVTYLDEVMSAPPDVAEAMFLDACDYAGLLP